LASVPYRRLGAESEVVAGEIDGLLLEVDALLGELEGFLGRGDTLDGSLVLLGIRLVGEVRLDGDALLRELRLDDFLGDLDRLGLDRVDRSASHSAHGEGVLGVILGQLSTDGLDGAIRHGVLHGVTEVVADVFSADLIEGLGLGLGDLMTDGVGGRDVKRDAVNGDGFHGKMCSFGLGWKRVQNVRNSVDCQ